MTEQDTKIAWGMVWLYALSLAGYPMVAAVTGALNVDNRPVSITFRAVFLALSLLVIYAGYRKQAPIHRGVFWLMYLVFWSMYSLRVLHDVLIADIPTAYEPEIYITFLFGVTIIPSFAFAFPINEATAKKAPAVALALLIVVQLLFLLSQGELLILAGEDMQRLQTNELNAVSLGAVGGLTVNFATLFLLYAMTSTERAARRGGLLTRIGYVAFLLGTIFLGFTTIFLSGSRGPLLGTLACYAIMFYAAYKHAKTRMSSVTLFAMAAISVVFTVLPFVVDFGTPILERLAATGRGEEMSDEGRFFLWQNGWDQALASPLIGSGLEEKTFVFYVHNLPLEAFMATGLLGALIWFFLFLVGTRRAINIILTHPTHGWIAVTFLYVLVSSILSGNLWNAGYVAHFLVALYGVRQIAPPIAQRYVPTRQPRFVKRVL